MVGGGYIADMFAPCVILRCPFGPVVVLSDAAAAYSFAALTPVDHRVLELCLRPMLRYDTHYTEL